MGRRQRGFFAELAHQQQLAEQRQRKAAAERAKLERQLERAAHAAERASIREQAAAEKANRAAYQEARKAEAEALTFEAVECLEEIDALLLAPLDLGDYVDIKSLKIEAEHPPFDPGELATLHPEPQLEAVPPEPQFVPPSAPTGVMKLFGKQQHQDALEKERIAWEREHKRWTEYVKTELPQKNARLREEHAARERTRIAALNRAEANYRQACLDREKQVAEANAQIESLRSGLAANEIDAINQYVEILLTGSVYPAAFPVRRNFVFDAEAGELSIRVLIPPPSRLPTVKAFKYVAASDEMRESQCTQKEQRDRYSRAVACVALRTFHEVFACGTKKWIKTVALTVETEEVSPATGLMETYRFVAAVADREEFLKYDLSRVNPVDTLAHMRSSVSKNPFALVPANPGHGIRRV